MAGATIETERLLFTVPAGRDGGPSPALPRPEVRHYLGDGEVIPESRTAAILWQNAEPFAERGFRLWGVSALDGPALLGFGG